MSRVHFRITLLLVAALAPAAAPRAQAAPLTAAPGPADPAAERLRLRAELDRVNAEIDALKRAGHGVGDDYRLRARLADAEALARRLVDLERRMGLTAATTAPAAPRVLPTASPSDGPAELEAKADILTDQSRRVRAAADALDARVSELKSRQDLRRRAAELDRDPFAPLEQSKRRTVSIASGSDSTHAGPVAGPSSAGDRAGGATSPGGSPATLTGSGPASPQGSIVVGTPPSSPTPVTVAPLTASLELRDLLDPATVADLGRLERGRAPSSLAALQKAVAALRARAAAIDTQAQAMRRAAQKP